MPLASIFRIGLWLAAIPLGCASLAWADEGMWTYDNLPSSQIRAKYGWSPDQAWLDHARRSSLRLSVGCSASFVSPDGLVLTNQHCGTDCLQALSDAKHDYDANGFYAPELADEKNCPRLEADQLTAITDVTKTIHAATRGLGGKSFADAERAAIARQEQNCSVGRDVRCQVVTLYHGGTYDLYTYRRYQDVRMVWTEEYAAAKFGGDLDNFNFPRYVLDITFLRIYDHGKPLRTRDFLHFATNPAKDGDLVFISGNPGSTSREDTVAQLQFDRDQNLPELISLYSEQRGMLQQMSTEGAEQQRITANDLWETENALKQFKGEENALVEGPLLPGKRAAEAELRRRVAADPALSREDGSAWDMIAEAIARQKLIMTRFELLEIMPRYMGSDLLRQAVELNRFAAESKIPNAQRLEGYTDGDIPALQQSIVSKAPDYPELDKTLITWWLGKIREELGVDDPDVLAILGKESPARVAAEIVDHSQLGNPAVRAKLLVGGAAAIDASRDPLLVFVRRLDGPARAVRADYEDNVEAVITRNDTRIAGAKFALEGASVHRDGTFTLRLSFGTVEGYAQNGKYLAPFTDFGGAYARATGTAPFRLPASWLRAEPDLDLATKLDMVTSNDSVGGNSGSPVIDRDGEVTGVIFDGNIQSLGGYYGYDPSVNRAIAVDVTALKLALPRIYHADRLVQELGW